ncbi:MAG: GTP pyrophosphokinase family protein [Enterococcus sp.]
MKYPIDELAKFIHHEKKEENYLEPLELYFSLVMMYQSALDEVETKLRIIDRELSQNTQVGRKKAIHQIQTRIKKAASLIEKLERKGIDFSPELVHEHINDIAGIRVVCPYTDDIYMILKTLEKQTDVTVVKVKDYITTPKPSGYRSLHAIVEIPVFFLQETKYLKVELQFRTIAMDFWASLEHSLRYKNDGSAEDFAISQRLEVMAEKISDMESEMLLIRQEIERMNQ